MLRWLALAALLSPLATAQTALSLHVGYVDFDLSGVGQTAVVDARVSTALHRFLTVEGGLGYSDTPQQFGDVAYLLPSAEVQAGLAIGRVRPFLGVGLGLFVPLEDPGERSFTQNGTTYTVDYDAATRYAATVGLGADVDVTDRLLVRATGRLRASGSEVFEFSGTFAELTAGLGYRF